MKKSKYIKSVFMLVLFCCVSCSKTGQLEMNIPVRATDPHTVTFDDGDFSFTSVITDDNMSACGTLSVEKVYGNNMLKFSDDMTVGLDGKVQKISINVSKLLDRENLPLVRSIEFDLYADALTDGYRNSDGADMKVPGTICCGGGTVTKNGKWYDFAEFQGGEYNLEMSGAVHGVFKFLLAESGFCWDEKMDDANFLIMRWGSENLSNIYIDNIVFYDENGKSLPNTVFERVNFLLLNYE